VCDGESDGCNELYAASIDGASVGCIDGPNEGTRLGPKVGPCDGCAEGAAVVGDALDLRLGLRLGLRDGARLGESDGCNVGAREGCNELYTAALLGASDGNKDSIKLGVLVSTALGASEGGIVLGGMLGACIGAAVGLKLGDPDGARLGDREGCSELYSAALLGASVGESDGKPDGAKLGALVGIAIETEGCVPFKGSCVRGAVVGFVVPVVAPADAIVGFSVVGETVPGLRVVGKAVVGKAVVGFVVVGLAGDTVEDVPDVGETAVHSSTLHATVSDAAGQACATPMVSAGATVRVREDEPPPHTIEQLLQPLQLPTLQSVHVIAEQAMLLDRAGHAEPPPYAASLTERERCELPSLHSAVQVAHRLHGVTAQSTGHVVDVHPLSSVVPEHVLPPFTVGTVTALDRRCTAVPHVEEQELHACQAPIEQSTGQSNEVQFCVAVRSGHCAPPLLAADVTERDRPLLPVPQLTEQVVHVPQAPTMQSEGQVCTDVH
jgi:hypothetical protein